MNLRFDQKAPNRWRTDVNVVATSHLTFFLCNQNLNLPGTNLFFNFFPFWIVITTPFIFIDKDRVVKAVLGTRHQTTAQFEWRWVTVAWFVTWQTQGDKGAEICFGIVLKRYKKTLLNIFLLHKLMNIWLLPLMKCRSIRFISTVSKGTF